MLKNQAFDLPHISRRNIETAGQRYWIKPKLALTVTRIDMNVCRLIALVRIEMESERPNTQDSRYKSSYRAEFRPSN